MTVQDKSSASPAEVNAYFEAVLKQMALPEAAKVGMRAKPLAEKIKLCEMYSRTDSQSKRLRPSDEKSINAIRSRPDRPPLDALRQLRTAIRTGNSQWLDAFYGAGGLDAFAAEACSAGKDEGNCTAISDNCAWNKGADLCQNKLCQCTGTNNGHFPEGAEEGYGETCAPWDQSSCEGWEDKDGVSLGLWCCMSFCFVDAKCPSATPHPALKGKYVSYVACPSDPEELKECPAGSEPKDAHGNPLPISSSVSQALEHALSSVTTPLLLRGRLWYGASTPHHRLSARDCP